MSEKRLTLSDLGIPALCTVTSFGLCAAVTWFGMGTVAEWAASILTALWALITSSGIVCLIYQRRGA